MNLIFSDRQCGSLSHDVLRHRITELKPSSQNQENVQRTNVYRRNTSKPETFPSEKAERSVA
jgi:hypothetical protein